MLCNCGITVKKGNPITFKDALDEAVKCNREFEIRLEGETKTETFGFLCIYVNKEDKTLNFGYKSRFSIELSHIQDAYNCNNEWKTETNQGRAKVRIVPSEFEKMLFHQYANPKLRINDVVINQNDYCLHDGIVNCYKDSKLKFQFGLSKVLCNEGLIYYVENTDDKRMFVYILLNTN